MTKDPKLVEYYRRRAPEYDTVFERDDPGYQADLQAVGRWVRSQSAGLQLLEVACGTGKWTREAVRSADSLVATDISQEPLLITRLRMPPGQHVRLCRADAYQLPFADATFTGVLACYLFSHISRAEHSIFLDELARVIEPGGILLMVDGVHKSGLGGRLVGPDDRGDTFRIRILRDGSVWKVRKNYYEDEELESVLRPHLADLALARGEFHWSVKGRTQR